MSQIIPAKAASLWALEHGLEKFFELGLTDGDMLTHEMLELVLEVPYKNKNVSASQFSQYQMWKVQRWEKLKSALLTRHQIDFDTEERIGYRLLPPNEQALFATRDMKQEVHKSLSKSIRRIENTRMDELTVDERRKSNEAGNKVRGLQQLFAQKKRNLLEEDE